MGIRTIIRGIRKVEVVVLIQVVLEIVIIVEIMIVREIIRNVFVDGHRPDVSSVFRPTLLCVVSIVCVVILINIKLLHAL